MKGKKLAAKIMLGLLLATPYGFNQAFAAELTLNSAEDVTAIDGSDWDAGGFPMDIAYKKGTQGNAITIDTNDNSLADKSIAGGYSSGAKREISNNTIIMNSGVVKGLYAGYSSGAYSVVENNKIIINGGTVTKYIYFATTAGYQSDLKNNSITLKNDANVSTAAITATNNGSISNQTLILDGWTGSTVKSIKKVNNLQLKNIILDKNKPVLTTTENSDFSKVKIEIDSFADGMDLAADSEKFYTIIDGNTIKLPELETSDIEKIDTSTENGGVRVHDLENSMKNNSLVSTVTKSVLAGKYVDSSGNVYTNNLNIDNDFSTNANVIAGAYASGENTAKGGKITISAAYDGVVYAGYSEEGEVGDNLISLGNENGMNAENLVLYGSNKEDSVGVLEITEGNNSVNTVNNFEIISLEKIDEKAATLSIKELNGDGTTININDFNNKVTITDNKDNNLLVVGTESLTNNFDRNNLAGNLQDLANTVEIEQGEKLDSVVAEEGKIFGQLTAKVDDNGNIIADSVIEDGNIANEGITELANVALMAWRAENDEMHQRMGELRSSTGEAGIWARMKRGESESGDMNIKNQYSTYQLGYDEKVGDSNWYLGGAISRTEGKSSFATGSGENQSTGFTVYGTYVGDDGQYVDLSAKYARLDNEFDVFGRGGLESTGDYRNNGYAFSAEYGKRIEAGNDFWVEPQVQLTYGHLSSANYTTSRGVKAAQDAMDSVVGRVGFAAGKDISAGNVYVKASYLYDFDGETAVSMTDGKNSAVYEQDLGGGWFEFGIGTNINLSESSHLYFDVEKAVGGEIDTPWQWNAGVRFDF